MLVLLHNLLPLSPSVSLVYRDSRLASADAVRGREVILQLAYWGVHSHGAVGYIPYMVIRRPRSL